VFRPWSFCREPRDAEAPEPRLFDERRGLGVRNLRGVTVAGADFEAEASTVSGPSKSAQAATPNAGNSRVQEDFCVGAIGTHRQHCTRFGSPVIGDPLRIRCPGRSTEIQVWALLRESPQTAPELIDPVDAITDERSPDEIVTALKEDHGVSRGPARRADPD
jgi:hypothetical protein